MDFSIFSLGSTLAVRTRVASSCGPSYSNGMLVLVAVPEAASGDKLINWV